MIFTFPSLQAGCRQKLSEAMWIDVIGRIGALQIQTKEQIKCIRRASLY